MGNNQSTPQRVPQEDIDEINQLVSKSPKDMYKYLENKCNGWQSVTVTIGILGESHRGKSSFINAARKLKPGDPGAAQVKNRECTMEQTSYGYSDNPKITLVDLPGVGTNRFQKDKYIEEIDFTRFDFLLIFSKDSFTEIDTWLATKLKERGKQFFFVRNFMENAVRESMYDNNINIREKDEAGNLTNEMKAFVDKEMEEVRTYCRKGLEVSKNDDVPIYCISNHFPERFEFSKLILDIASHLPEIQKQALTLSITICTEEIFRAKKNILKKKIKYYAALSGLAGAVPLPGVDLLVDVPLIVSTLKSFKQQFGIDYEKDPDGVFFKRRFKNVCADLESSTQNEGSQKIVTNLQLGDISDNAGISEQGFTESEDTGSKDHVKGTKEGMPNVLSLLGRITEVGTKSYVTAILVRWASTELLDQTTKLAGIATLGIGLAAASLIGGALSFVATYHLLLTELNKIEELASEVTKLKIKKLIR